MASLVSLICIFIDFKEHTRPCEIRNVKALECCAKEVDDTEKFVNVFVDNYISKLIYIFSFLKKYFWMVSFTVVTLTQQNIG